MSSALNLFFRRPGRILITSKSIAKCTARSAHQQSRIHQGSFVLIVPWKLNPHPQQRGKIAQLALLQSHSNECITSYNSLHPIKTCFHHTPPCHHSLPSSPQACVCSATLLNGNGWRKSSAKSTSSRMSNSFLLRLNPITRFQNARLRRFHQVQRRRISVGSHHWHAPLEDDEDRRIREVFLP